MQYPPPSLPLLPTLLRNIFSPRPLLLQYNIYIILKISCKGQVAYRICTCIYVYMCVYLYGYVTNVNIHRRFIIQRGHENTRTGNCSRGGLVERPRVRSWPLQVVTRYCFTSRLYCTMIFFANTPFIVQYIAQYYNIISNNITSYCILPPKFEVFLRCLEFFCFVFCFCFLGIGFWMGRGV